MSYKFKAVRVIAVAAASVSAFVAMGFGPASQTVGVVAEVPLLCRVSFNAGSGAFSEAGLASIGATQEFCNSATGYKVFARAAGADEGSTLIVDGRRFPITGDQEFMIVDNSGPARTSRQISLDAGDGEGGGQLSLRIQAQ
jgi:hypothetical protein